MLSLHSRQDFLVDDVQFNFVRHFYSRPEDPGGRLLPDVHPLLPQGRPVGDFSLGCCVAPPPVSNPIVQQAPEFSAEEDEGGDIRAQTGAERYIFVQHRRLDLALARRFGHDGRGLYAAGRGSGAAGPLHGCPLAHPQPVQGVGADFLAAHREEVERRMRALWALGADEYRVAAGAADELAAKEEEAAALANAEDAALAAEMALSECCSAAAAAAWEQRQKQQAAQSTQAKISFPLVLAGPVSNGVLLDPGASVPPTLRGVGGRASWADGAAEFMRRIGLPQLYGSGGVRNSSSTLREPSPAPSIASVDSWTVDLSGSQQPVMVFSARKPRVALDHCGAGSLNGEGRSSDPSLPDW